MINFPDTPSVGDTFVVGDRKWRWNGSFWAAVPTTGATGPAGAVGPAGAQGPQGPAPSGNGFVYVVNGIVETPSNDLDAGTF